MYIGKLPGHDKKITIFTLSMEKKADDSRKMLSLFSEKY